VGFLYKVNWIIQDIKMKNIELAYYYSLDALNHYTEKLSHSKIDDIKKYLKQLQFEGEPENDVTGANYGKKCKEYLASFGIYPPVWYRYK